MITTTPRSDRFCSTFGIELPIVQAGMAFASDAPLTIAVTNAGGLGAIGTGGIMGTRELRRNIQDVKAAVGDKPFAVNIVIPTGGTDDAAFGQINLARKHLDICIEEGVQVITTALGDPRPFIPELNGHGIKVIPTVGRLKQAINCARAGAAAVAVQGSESGGHVGPSSLLYIGPAAAQAVDVPVLFAGCMTTSAHVQAALDLGASGAWVGTRFAASDESCAHENYKRRLVEAGEGSTTLTRAMTGKTNRGLRNAFTESWVGRENEILPYPQQAAEEYWRSRAGVYEGDVEQGFLSASESVALIDSVLPAAEIVAQLSGQTTAVASGAGTSTP
jgi:enoyl-[acyl-carrier protein] reductase II